MKSPLTIKAEKLRQAAQPANDLADPWQQIRESIAKVRSIGRAYLLGQCWLGWQLAKLKQEHQKARGSNKTGPVGQFGRTEKSWTKIVESETDLPVRTADRFIQLYQATKAKLARRKQTQHLQLLDCSSPMELSSDEIEELQELIATLVEGETQGSLMRELKVIPPKAKPPENPGGSRDKPQPDAYQMAFLFFEPVASTLFTLRTSDDTDLYLESLPEHPTEDKKVARSTLEQDARDLLRRIEIIREREGGRA